ncbi:MAG: hypothetical protein ACP5NB_05870 [Chloroflexia bacterium]
MTHWTCDLAWDTLVSFLTFHSRRLWTPLVHPPGLWGLRAAAHRLRDVLCPQRPGGGMIGGEGAGAYLSRRYSAAGLSSDLD